MKDLQQMLIKPPEVKESGMSASDVPTGAEFAILFGATLAVCIYLFLKGNENEKNHNDKKNT